MRTIIRLFGHGTGGSPSERIMASLGMPICHTSILRQLKANAPQVQDCPNVRVVGIDEWAWWKGTTYGTVIVDLERREVIDLLPDRATASVAKWFSDHPEVEFVSRDRAGVYADGARQGAPQARQGADRFHLLMNFRETVAHEMNGIGQPIRENSSAGEDHEYKEHGYAAREQILALTRRADRQAVFDEIRALCEAGKTVKEISGQLRLGVAGLSDGSAVLYHRSGTSWTRSPCTPADFGAFLERRRAEGITNGRQLLARLSCAATLGLIAISRVFSRLARMPVSSSRKLRV